MGLESPSFINDLNTAWPLGGDNESDGDGHLRAIKTALKASLPNYTRARYMESTVAKTAAYSVVLADSEKWILCDATAGAFAATFPAASTFPSGTVVGVKKVDSTANAVTVSATADGAASTILSNQYDFVLLKSDGAAYHKIGYSIASFGSGAAVNAEVSVVSAATTDVLGAAGVVVAVTGATGPITSFGTGANRIRFVRFSGAPTITHNGTSLITPNAKDITVTAGDTFILVSDASSNVRIWHWQSIIGKQPIWIPATAMVARTTNGAASGTVEATTNKNMLKTLDFDATTQEFAQFDIRMPVGWNEGTVTFVPVWSHAATSVNFGVVWGLDAVAVSNDDASDVAFGTEQTSTDTGGTTNDSYQGPESSAITIAGTPAAGDLVMFRVHRDPANGSDTMAIDARLHGILLYITLDTAKEP